MGNIVFSCGAILLFFCPGFELDIPASTLLEFR